MFSAITWPLSVHSSTHMAPFVNTLIVQLRELLGSVAGQVNLCLYILSTEISSQNNVWTGGRRHCHNSTITVTKLHAGQLGKQHFKSLKGR